MPPPTGFAFEARHNGDVVITHHGCVATVLRGHTAATFLSDLADDDPQELMARLTGNYRRGNERMSRDHPRNRRP